MEITDTVYRFRGSVPAGKTTILAVKEEIIQGETIAILPTDLGQLEFYSHMGEIPKDVRDALLKAMSLKSALVETERQIKERNRLLTKLNDQETIMEKLHGEIDQLKRSFEHQRNELETYLSNTTVG